MEIIQCEQGSDKWFEIRLGMVTASNFVKVLAKGQGKTRALYMFKLAAERLTGLREDTFKNAAMEAGSETEAEAREYYEIANDCKIDQVGFVKRDDWIGGSPDGLMGNDGLIEIKCPLSSTHVANIVKNTMPSEYKAQVQGLLWITERQWCDFISYDPRIVSRPMFCKRVERDDDYIDSLNHSLVQEVERFVEELKEIVDKIQGDF